MHRKNSSIFFLIVVLLGFIFLVFFFLHRMGHTVVYDGAKAKASSTLPVSGTYTIDTEKSTIQWHGTQNNLGFVDSGTIKLVDGVIVVKGDLITIGKLFFNEDSLSIKSTQIGMGSADVEEAINQYIAKNAPTSNLIFQSLSNKTNLLGGEFTAGDYQHSFSFPSQTVDDNGVLTLTATITINPAEWVSVEGLQQLGSAAVKIAHEQFVVSLDIVASLES